MFLYYGAKLPVSDSPVRVPSAAPTRPPEIEILLSLAGDCTLGSDDNFGYAGSFHEVYDTQRDNAFFFGGVSSLFSTDDYTLVNLEATFTGATQKRPKAFNFKGPKHYVNILRAGGVEGVNIANNHILDYGAQGRQDTIDTLRTAGVDYSDHTVFRLRNIKGVRFGFAGFCVHDDGATQCERELRTAIKAMDAQGAQAKIISFHWGVERSPRHSAGQKALGRLAIDLGASLVVGHHPHVLQGVETYKGRHIFYSLGNFSFGGNRNPPDYDTMVAQERLTFSDGALQAAKTELFPCSVSSVRGRNNYRPTLLQGTERERVLQKVLRDSVNFSPFDPARERETDANKPKETAHAAALSSEPLP
jgi:poly-gamma-glutamate synthesis protein (capsule biosynthesis protein)